MKKSLLVICVLALFSAAVRASDNAAAAFMPLDQVRQGMKGYGLTVFQGSTPERFDVEVLGILDGVPGPKQSIIIARLSGGQVDRTGVFQGISGSPVYIDGRLVGAVAYAFPFSKEPIAGITPIRYMIDIFENAGERLPAPTGRLSFNELMGEHKASGAMPEQFTAQVGPRAAANAALSPIVGQTIRHIATPVTFSGIPQSVVDMFGDDLRRAGLQTIGGVGGGSSLEPLVPYSSTTLAPGSSVSVQLVRGDFTVDAAGTVTLRDGDKIYAFGHPFLSSGSTSWPMSEASVITVVPNVNNSFKLSTGGNLVGSISQDRATGIYGQLGQAPRMIPVSLSVRTSRNKTEVYRFEMISDSFLTPLLMRMAVFSAIAATERQVGSHTIKLSGRIKVRGEADIVLDNTFSTLNGAPLFAAVAVERPMFALLSSGFDPVSLEQVELEITSSDERSSGTLSRLWVDKPEVRRGDTLEIYAFARNGNGEEFVERIPLEIPADAPVGPLVILVGDGASINQTERAQGGDFVPKDLGQLVRAINRLKKNNRLYVKVLGQGVGAVVNNEEMPALPPSVLATLGSRRTSGGYAPLSITTIAERELPPSQFMISGQRSITINVAK